MADILQNKDYDLISVIYNASQAADTCNQYIRDAESDQEVRQFFSQVKEVNSDLVQQGKNLLKSRLQ